MSVAERIRRLFGRDRMVDTEAGRIDSLTAARGTDHLQGAEHGGGIPPNYLPTASTRAGRRSRRG